MTSKRNQPATQHFNKKQKTKEQNQESVISGQTEIPEQTTNKNTISEDSKKFESLNHTLQDPKNRPQHKQIKDLKVYDKSNYTLKCRVVRKSPLKKLKNNKTYITILIKDTTGEIKITAFGKNAFALDEELEFKKVYYFTRFTVMKTNPTYSKDEFRLSANDDIMTLEAENDTTLSNIEFHFFPIKDMQNVKNKTLIDIVAIIHEISEPSNTTKKDGTMVKKRFVSLVDESMFLVVLCLWGEAAEQFNGKVGTVIAIKNAILIDYERKELNFTKDTSFILEPEQKNYLKTWYDKVEKEFIPLHKNPIIENIQTSTLNFNTFYITVKVKTILLSVKKKEPSNIFSEFRIFDDTKMD